MTSIHNSKISKLFYKYRFYLLLLTLLQYFFVPTFDKFSIPGIVFKIFTSTILILSGANFIQKDKSNLRRSWFVFGIFNIGLAFAYNVFPENETLEKFLYLMFFFFFVVITVNLLQQIIKIPEVDVDVIVGSFCGYVLIGIISFFLFVIVNVSIPNSFSGIPDNTELRNNELFYFAFTCLTTVGFGDIVPTAGLSQKLAVFTAAVGQFYIAVVVAILISRFMQENNRTKIR